MANKDFKIKNGLDMSSPLPVSMGGTGQTSTTNSLNALLPSQSGNANKLLASDGTNTTWVAQTTAYQRGGTASRPASATAGDLYYNTDYNYFESYTANGWFPIAAAPGIPTGVTATNQGTSRAFNDGQMSVAFTPASSGGAPTSFVLTPSPTTSPATFTVSTSPVTVTGLSSSTQYTYTVLATSPYGTSSASTASTAVTATTIPQAPSVSATAGDTQSTITITPGATGGSAITGYTIVSSPATTTQTTSNTTYTFTGLTNGTAYTFTATATNANGTSAASSASNSITPITPGIPLLGTWIQGSTHPSGTGSANFWGVTTVSGASRLLALDNPRVDTLRYNDGKGGSWATGANRPAGQGLATSSKHYTSDNRMYTVGGDTGDAFNVYATNAEGSSWTTMTASPTSASWGNGAYFNGYLYTINNLGQGSSSQVSRTTTNNGTSWQSYASTPTWIFGSSAAPTHSKLFFWAGWEPGFSAGSVKVYSTTGSGSWTTETNAPHSGTTFGAHGFATNGTDSSRIYTMSGASIWSRTPDSGTWVSENALPGGRSATVIHMVKNGSQVWIQAVASDNTVWYQQLI